MRPSRFPVINIRSVIGVLVALVLLGIAGATPAAAAPVREQAPLEAPSAVSLPLTVLPAEHTETSPVTEPFTDMPTNHDFYQQISWLAETGVSTGWSGPEGLREFRPYQPVLRDQMAAFLYRMAGSPAFEAPATSPFADVPTDHDFYEEISWLAETGVSTGWSGEEGTRLFRPYQSVLRDQMAAFLYRMAGSPTLEASATSPFADVPTDHDFYQQISWLAETGVSTGWSGEEGTRLFRPYQSVLRDQMAAFLYRIDPLLPGRDASTAEVVSSFWSAYAIRADGTVWAWGKNETGQLGNSTTTDSSVPVQVAGLSDVQSLEASYASAAYALRADGTVWAWGGNNYGQLGNGSSTSSSVPVQMAGLSDIRSVESNYFSVFAVTAEGAVWAWGVNSYGGLGNGTRVNSYVPVQVTGLPGVRSIQAGYASTYALTTEGTVWAWGLNSFGQLGDGTKKDSTVPVQVAGLSGVQSIEVNNGSAYALRTDGTVWAWGYNGLGRLGDGTTWNSSVPVQVAGLSGVQSIEVNDGSAYALRTDGTVWAWGSNGSGQLGNGTTSHSSVPVQVAGLSGVQSIEVNDGSAYALRTDGTVWAWGSNGSGQLGNGTTDDSSVPVRVSGLSGVQSIDSTHRTAYALTTDGTVWAWGWNHDGQLGNGTRTDSSVPVPASRLNG